MVGGALGYLEGILMVSDEAIMMLMALQFGFMAYVLMKLDVKKSESERFKNEIEKSLASINFPDLNLGSIKEELVELVEDMMSNMRIPSIADHLGGAVAQIMQMKQMKMAQEMGLVQGSPDNVADNVADDPKDPFFDDDI